MIIIGLHFRYHLVELLSLVNSKTAEDYVPENIPLSYAGISLLYIEDEAATREQVSRVLAARGYQLTVAEDGEQGLEIFRE